MSTDVLSLLLGLAVLVVGANLLVPGATRLAAVLGVPPLVTGLTVVAIATSSPELAVAAQSALSGQPDLTVGNVVGSSLINVMVILGLTALVAPLRVQRRVVRLDVPAMIGAATLLYGFAFDGAVSRLEGLTLGVLFGIYTYWSIRAESAAAPSEQPDAGVIAGERTPRAAGVGLALVAGGLALLVVGSDWLVTGAVAISRALGVSELIIGLTVVSFGTASPELTTTLVAAFRGERDLAVGNAVGSVTFNSMVVIGLGALLSPVGLVVPQGAISLDIPVLVAATVACLPIAFRGEVIERWEGALLLGLYACYVAYLALDATGHEALPDFSAIMLALVLPLVAMTLLALTLRFIRESRT